MKTRMTLVAAALIAGGTLTANAHEMIDVEGTIEAGESGSYVKTSDGTVLKTGSSGCTHTGSFSDDDIINACEGIEDEPEPVQEEVVEAPVVEEAPKVQTRIDTRELFGRTLFDFNSADLSEDGLQALGELTDNLSQFQGISDIVITGHTDSTGPEEYNMTLSEARAATVAAFFSERYPEANVSAVGMGETQPVASNETSEGRARNRRVEIDVTAEELVTFE